MRLTVNRLTVTLEGSVSTQNTRQITYVQPVDPPDNFKLVAEFTIKGKPERKSNSRRIVRNKKTKKMLVIKSQEALIYADSFAKQVPDSAKVGVGNKDEILALWANVYYPSNRQDLSIEMIKDLLEKNGVVANDRWIKAHLVFGAIDRENPRVDLKLYVIE